MKTIPTQDPWALAQAALDRRALPFDDEALLEALEAQLDAPGFEDQLDALLALESVTTQVQNGAPPPPARAALRWHARRKPLAAAAAAVLIVALSFGTQRGAPNTAPIVSMAPSTPFDDQLAVAHEPPFAEPAPSRVAIRSLAITIERDRATSPFAASRLRTKTTHSTLTPR